MENNKDFVITSKQLFFILFGTMVGTGIITLPRLTTKIIEQDAWIAAILGAVLPFVSLALIQKVCSKYPDKTFVPLLESLLGKYLGKLFAAVFAIYSLLLCAVLLRLFSEIIGMYLLPLTPHFCSGYIIMEILRLKTHKTAVLGLIPIIALAAWFPKDLSQVSKLSDYIGYVSLGVGIVLPLILLIVSLLTAKKGVKLNEAK